MTFTFITITYNHSKYIVEHLESIKSIIQRYGSNVEVNYLLIDDCSADETVSIVKNWIGENRELFSEVTIHENEKNQGMVKNVLFAIRKCRGSLYKYLSGDDKYYLNDIFSFVNDMEDCVYVTPVIPFGNERLALELVKRYRCLVLANMSGKIKKLMKLQNCFAAPGVFVPGKLLENDEYEEYLKQFRNIEDYPTWHYLMNIKNIPVKVVNNPYIYYRFNSGISSNSNHARNAEFIQERKKMENLTGVKLKSSSTKMSIYRIEWAYWRLKTILFRKKINQSIGDDADVLRFYSRDHFSWDEKL